MSYFRSAKTAAVKSLPDMLIDVSAKWMKDLGDEILSSLPPSFKADKGYANLEEKRLFISVVAKGQDRSDMDCELEVFFHVDLYDFKIRGEASFKSVDSDKVSRDLDMKLADDNGKKILDIVRGFVRS
jgi:hypothetical protein